MRIYDLLYIAAVASSLAIGPRDKELGGDGSKHRMALALQLNSKDGVRSDIVSAFDDQKEGGIRFDFSEIGQTRSKRSEQETPIVESDSSPTQADANAEVGGLSDMFWQLLLIAKQITIEKVTILKDILSMLDKIKSIQDGMGGNDDGAGNIVDAMGALAVSSLNAASVLHEKEVAVQARKLQDTDSAKKLSDHARLQSLTEEKDREDREEEEEEEWKVLHNGKNKRAEAPTIEKDHIHDEECDLSEHLKDENEEDDDDEKKEDEDDSSGEETKGMKSKLKKLMMMKKKMKMKKMKMKEKEKEEEKEEEKSNDDMVDDKGADNVDYESDDECEEEEPKKAGKLAGLKAKFSKSKKPFDKEEDEEDEEEKKVDEDCASDFAGEIQEPIDSAEECKDGANDDEEVCEGDIDGKDEKEEVCDDGEDGDKKTSMISKLKGMMKKKKKTSSENDNLKEEPDCEVEEEESQEETPKKGGKIAGIKAKFLKLKKPLEGEQEDDEQDEEKREGEEDSAKIDCKDAKSKDNEKREILHIKGKMYKRGDSILERHYDLSHLFKDDIPKLSLKALHAKAGNPKQPPGQLINSANGDA